MSGLGEVVKPRPEQRGGWFGRRREQHYPLPVSMFPFTRLEEGEQSAFAQLRKRVGDWGLGYQKDDQPGHKIEQIDFPRARIEVGLDDKPVLLLGRFPATEAQRFPLEDAGIFFGKEHVDIVIPMSAYPYHRYEDPLYHYMIRLSSDIFEPRVQRINKITDQNGRYGEHYLAGEYLERRALRPNKWL